MTAATREPADVPDALTDRGGAEGDVTPAFGCGPGEEAPTDAAPRAVEALATRHGPRFVPVRIRRTRRDLSVPPRFEGPGVPYAVVLGAEEVRTLPGDRARRVPARAAATRTGPADPP
ncbi:DUF6177 family protein [Streptomyces sp. NTH33]|uniref:DUF6177 family protein n=1 Tax=Streptomyces sp. NTH33 TaxID=1735453 RepID=UPI003F8F2E5A